LIYSEEKKVGYSREEKAMIWLCGCGRFEYRLRVALLKIAKDPAKLFDDWENIYRQAMKIGESGVYKNVPDFSERDADAFLEELKHRGYFAVTLLGGDFPKLLKHSGGSPLVLFGAGRRELLSRRKFTVVGSRITPPFAEKQTRAISEELASHFTIVTGFAEGGDRAAAEGALKSGNLISVLPVGLNECYPVAHTTFKKKVLESGGLFLSEYPPDAKLSKFAFHARNRILAGLSEGMLVVSAGEKSGTLITATYAAEYGRDVFAFPYNIGVAQGVGCNGLIKKGAYLCTGAEDILSVYGIEGQEKKTVSLSPDESRILAILRESGELHAAVIAERAGLPAYAAAAVLSALEIKNLAAKSGGNKYTIV